MRTPDAGMVLVGVGVPLIVAGLLVSGHLGPVPRAWVAFAIIISKPTTPRSVPHNRATGCVASSCSEISIGTVHLIPSSEGAALDSLIVPVPLRMLTLGRCRLINSLGRSFPVLSLPLVG